MEAETSTAAELSHPVFFNGYQQIFGLTGTIGTPIERQEIQSNYSVTTFDVPAFKPSMRKDFKPIIKNNVDEHQTAMLDEVHKMMSCDRSILILCSDIHQSNDLSQYLAHHDVEHNVYNATQLKDNDFIIAQAGLPKAVTVATNTAGRGTDIMLHPQVLNAGGLHVVFSYYPESLRVEDQGFGRAGRQGQPGSARMILNRELLDYDIMFKSMMPDQLFLSTIEHQRVSKINQASKQRAIKSEIALFHYEQLELFSQKLTQWDHELQTSLAGISRASIDLYKQRNFNQQPPNHIFQKDSVEAHIELTRQDILSTWGRLYSEVTKKPPIINSRFTVNQYKHQASEQFQAVFNQLDSTYFTNPVTSILKSLVPEDTQ